MGQDKPPQYSDAPSSNQYTPKFSPEQRSFLSLVNQFAAVKPLSLKFFLNLLSEDEELFAKEFPETAHESLSEEIDAMLVNPTYKPLLSTHLAKRDYSAALVSIVTLVAITPPNQGLSSQASPRNIGTNAHDQPPPSQAVQTTQEKSSSGPDGQSTDQYIPKFSPEQISFLDLVHQFASVKPLSLKIFLNLVSEDDELLSKEFPETSTELIEGEIGGMLTNPTFKSLLSAYLSKQDYSAALISILTLIAILTSAVDADGRQPRRYLRQPEDDPSPSGHKSLLDLAERFATAEPLNIRKFLDIFMDDADLLSRAFPGRSAESLTAEISRLSVNPSFQKELGSHLKKQDYLAALLLTNTVVAGSSPSAGVRPPQYGVPLEQLEDPYSKGLYGLYDLLWNRQENIVISQTILVPSLPYTYVNFEQPTTTAVLPASFRERSWVYSCDTIRLPGYSDAILPANDKHLKEVLIRTCYRDILKDLELDDHHAVVLGQPGTGKSCLLLYILTERLRKRQATVLQLDEDDVYYFSEVGAMRFPAKVSFDGHNLHGAWFLVDCSEHTQTIPDIPSSVYRFPSLKVVYAISPRINRHMAWSKQSIAKQLWIYAYSWEELYVLRSAGFEGFSVNDEKLAFSYLKYGSNPHTCMLAASSTGFDAKQLRKVRDELEAQGVAAFHDVAASCPTLHTIIPSLDPSLTYVVVPASPYLAERFYQRGSTHHAWWGEYLNATSSIPHMSEAWRPQRLSVRTGQSVVLSQDSPEHRLNYSHSTVLKFTDMEHLKKIYNGSSGRLLIPDACTFPVDAIVYDTSYNNYWLVLFTTGTNRVVDGHALKELLALSPGGRQDLWKFLLVVPELCDCVGDIRVDIHGAEKADFVQDMYHTGYGQWALSGSAPRKMRRYVLRL